MPALPEFSYTRIPCMTPSLVAVFACACGLSVANIYYSQPLLDAFGTDFRIEPAAIGGIMTATQVGCALALLSLVPLGDRMDRRRLMLMQLAGLVVALVGVGMVTSITALLFGMLALGLLATAMTQGLIAYAATAASPAQRGRVVGAAQGGVVIGLLLGRVLAGGIADLAGWRMVYFCAAAVMLIVGGILWRLLPPQAPSAERLTYLQLLLSMCTLLRHERVLQIRGVLAMLLFAAFNVLWTVLALLLSAPPYALSHAQIGAFGLVGVAGALGAARAGAWADRGLGQWTSGLALILLLASWLPLMLAPYSLWWLAIGIIALDLGGQAIHVTNQGMIFSTQPHAHSRLVGCYMLFYAVGSGLGAISATGAWSAWGWPGVCLLGACISALALAFWALTLKYMPKTAEVR